MKNALVLVIAMLTLTWAVCAGATTEISTPTALQTAAPQPVAPFVPNINQGNFEISGSVGLGYSTPSGFLAQLNPTFRYFIFKHFSFGITGDVNASQVGTAWSGGPSASFYFWNSERWAAYLGEDVTYTFSNYLELDSSPWESYSKLGFNYFITREVAFGPALVYSHNLGDGSAYPGDLTMLASFGLFF